MMSQIPRNVFIYWKALHELKLTTLYEKEEYYLAAIRRDILATVAGEKAGEIDDYLINFKFKTQEELDEDELNKHEEYMSALGGLANKVNKSSENGMLLKI